MSKKRRKAQKLSADTLKAKILAFLRKQPTKRFNPKQIVKKLNISNSPDAVLRALEELEKEGKVFTGGDFRFKIERALVERARTGSTKYSGVVDITRTGSAYIVCDEHEYDIHVSAKYLNTALNGDRVIIRAWTPKGRRKKEGEVIEILERHTEFFIGTVWLFPQFAIVVPDGDNQPEVLIENPDFETIEDKDRVVVKITNWKTDRNGRFGGVITSVLGQPGSSDIDMKAILINNGFALEFSEEVMSEANALKEEITKGEVAKRRDMRQVTTFTIDPETAKDFDDALSIQYMDNGNCEIGIHIADVSHYVKAGTELDKEAYNRSTSVYLVDRVCPMLPEKLSNELCSLRPEEEKLTFSAVFTFDKDDKIVDEWYGRTVIYSDKRFTYEEAQEIIEGGEGPFKSELKVLNRIATKLRKKRFKNGAINFETEEVRFKLDEHGVPIEAYVKERKEAHLLVEDFMLLANKGVATFMVEKGKRVGMEIPFIYRVHDIPDMDRVEELVRFAKDLDFEMHINSFQDVAKAYNRLSEAAEKDPGLKMLQPLAIRTMAKAEYTTDNIGHFGLGFKNYTHFTSPIRRYSDVLAHRILEDNLGKEVKRSNEQQLETMCKHISTQERRAMDAERESIKYKQVEYLQNHIGDEFDGYVSGFSDKGIFITIEENACEGWASFGTMREAYAVDSSRHFATANRSGDKIKMGDMLRVRVVDTNLSKRQIELEVVMEE